MNGPENYAAAEQLLDAADAYETDGAPQTAAARRSEAQVRANLAQAAAFAMAQPVAGMADEQGLDQSDFDDWYAAVNGLPPEERKPVEEYPGELAHLRDLLASLAKAADGNDAMNELLIDHFSDSRIVDPQLTADEDHDGPSASELHEMDQADEAALDAAADEEFAADTEGQR